MSLSEKPLAPRLGGEGLGGGCPILSFLHLRGQVPRFRGTCPLNVFGSREFIVANLEPVAPKTDLRRLPGEQRALLSMFYLDGLSIAEIAQALEVPPGTVKSRLYQARQELKALLKGAEDERVG